MSKSKIFKFTMRNLKEGNMENEEGVGALFLYATEGILIVNEKGEISRINPSAEKLFGYEKDELIGQKIETLIPKRFSKHKEYRQKYSENPHPRAMGFGMELYGLKKDGSEFPVEISLSPYSSGNGRYVIAFIIDITQRKQSEEKLKNYSGDLEKQVKNRTLILEEAIDELEKTKKELHAALEKEKELNELKSRFVSIASHEFRTPLTTMLSSVSLITKYGEQNDRENQLKHVNKIKSSISHLTDMLNDFLSLSRLEEGKIGNFPEEINLKTFLKEVITDIKPMAAYRQNLLQVHSGKEQVNIDKKLLRNILFNLISNAIKFSPDGGQIEIRADVSDEEVKISVRDNGIGISKKDQKHVFERFFRADNVTHIQGTGLGLNIVAKYTELINGSIHFESQEGKGTIFTVKIPQ